VCVCERERERERERANKQANKQAIKKKRKLPHVRFHPPPSYKKYKKNSPNTAEQRTRTYSLFTVNSDTTRSDGF
jgi:DNA invertase Pin-like site-specific DNA recombinase